MRREQIEEMQTVINRAVFSDFKNGHNVCIKTLSEHLYNAGYRKQEWISVEERLPEVGTRVVGYDYESNVRCYFITEGRWWIDDGWNTAKGWGITHWMPLPEPPKGGEG